MKPKILYVFSGELASGAEVVMEALICKNAANADAHLFISPGKFTEKLVGSRKPYPITVISQLKKLNRSKRKRVFFVLQAIQNYLAITYKTAWYIYRHNIDIIHANTNVPAAYLLPTLFFTKIFRPSTTWLWTDHDLKDFRIDNFFSNLCLKHYHKTLVVSNAVKAKYGDKSNVVVLYNGLDTDVFRPDKADRADFRRQFEIDEATIVFAIAGVISPRKRQLELMEAFSKIKTNGEKVHLFLAGNFGPDDLEYNEKVKVLIKQQTGVKYIGHIDNMVGFYNGCDVIVNNSSAVGSEPFGATIYEAMSCETLVMASDTGGLPELIDHEKNGFLFAPDSENALVKMMQTIVQTFYNLDVVRTAAREKVLNKFGFDIIVTQYNSLLGIASHVEIKEQ